MAATDREDEFKSLRIDVLDAIREFRIEQIENRKMVQRGFEEIAREQGADRRARIALESEVKALRAIEGDCQQKLTRLEADGKARALLMKAVVVAVVLLFIASLVQSALWWYVVTRLFNV